MNVKIRLRYSKTGRAKYISHLDLSTTIHRALLRCETKLKYSEGFNPHPYISVALPLKVGDESVCELLDFAVLPDLTLEDDFIIKLNLALPEGIEVKDAYFSQRKFSQIAWVEVFGSLFYTHTNPHVADRLNELFSRDEIIIPKRRKSGVADINIAPHIKDIEFYHDANGTGFKMKAKLSAQNPAITPSDIIGVFENECPLPCRYTFLRTEFLDADFLPFA